MAEEIKKEEAANEASEEVVLTKAEKKAAKKEAKKAAKKAAKAKGEGLWSDFKKFISKGNVLDMAVGVVIGGAFSAIVTAVVNILLSVCSWGIPGGLAGLITILPPAFNNAAQIYTYTDAGGVAHSLQSFQVTDFATLAHSIGEANGAADPVTYGTNILNANFTKYGGVYAYNGAATINWGAVINAVISFLIVAIVLFTIVKIAAVAERTRDELKAKAQEAYWVKHPEERPAPVVPGKPEPTDHQLLKEMLAIMKKQAGIEEKPEKKD